MKKFISPSICCCDLSCLEESVHELERLHVEYIHVDIMDGEFVNNYCLGTEFIPLLHSMTNIPLDIHLMIMNPDRKLDYFSFAPEDVVTVHAESTNHIQRLWLQFMNAAPERVWPSIRLPRWSTANG